MLYSTWWIEKAKDGFYYVLAGDNATADPVGPYADRAYANQAAEAALHNYRMDWADLT